MEDKQGESFYEIRKYLYISRYVENKLMIKIYNQISDDEDLKILLEMATKA